jgi:hypothetical protein
MILITISTGCGGGTYGTQTGENINVRGAVLEENTPVAGVIVKDIQSNAQTVTDSNGQFEITAFLKTDQTLVALQFNDSQLFIPASAGFTTVVKVQKSSDKFILIDAQPKKDKNNEPANPSDPISTDESGSGSPERCDQACQDKRWDNRNNGENGHTPGNEGEATPTPTEPDNSAALGARCTPLITKYLDLNDINFLRTNDTECYLFYLDNQTRF